MKTKISSFLKERQDRFKPDEARKLNLERIYKITQNGEIFISDKPSNTNMILVKQGDLILSGIGIAKGGGNSLNIYEGEKDVLATIHYSSYEINKKLISKEFLKIFLISPHFRKLLQENSPNGIKAEIKPKHFLPIELELPPIKEQKKIVIKVNSMKNEINELEQNVSHDENLLQKLRQAILQEAVQGKLVPQNPDDELASELLKKIKKEKEKLIKEKKIKKGKEFPAISDDEIPYELPKSWEWCRLGEIAQHNTGKTLDKGRNKGEFRDYITTSNLYWGHFSLENLKKMPIEKNELQRFSARKGDLLVIEGGEAGRAAIWENDNDVCFQNHIHRVRPYCNISSYYLLKFFEKINLTKEINNYRKGVAISSMSGKALSSIIIPLPPLAEQRRIVEKVDALMKFCDELELRIKENKEGSERLMGAVLREAFNND